MTELRPFQRRFIDRATAPGIDTAALSVPRGNGKSFLAGHLLTRFLTPDDPLFRPGLESVLISGSIEQCRIVFRYCRRALEHTGQYRFLDSATRCGITHAASNTRIRVHGSNSRTIFGLVGVSFVVWDEPGAAEVVSGGQLWDAVTTSMGKPGSPLTAILIGTVAPSTEGWWQALIESGSRPGLHVQALQGDPKKWDEWSEIRRCNPLVEISPEFRKKLLQERDDARRDERLRSRFMSYRMNRPTGDEADVLLTVENWELVTARQVAGRDGLPVVGIDLAAGRSWDAAVAVWRSGRTEAIAVAPGIPGIEAQEKRDRVPAGRYRILASKGVLRVAEGLRVQPPRALWEAICAMWGGAALIVCDRFRLSELMDATAGAVPILPRVARWSESSADIRALRKMAADGPLSVAEESRPLLAASLAVATVKTDDAGNSRLVKRGSNNCARDDVAVAWTLAAGEVHRRSMVPEKTELYAARVEYDAVA